MGANIILFVLGNLFLRKAEGGDKLPAEARYGYETSYDTFLGIQANEAPVKYLVKSGNDSGRPVTKLVYLRPDSCLTPNVPAEQVMATIPGFETSGQAISTEEFFLARLHSYCAKNGYAMPEASSVPFNPLRPADSLSGIVDALEDGARISIDITGGPRDAVILLTLATQIAKMGVKGATIGEILYTNYNEKTIYKQNNSFDLIDLVNAINSFTDYGRADQLKSFFSKSPYIKQPTKKLCRAMEAFSDALAICQVDNVEYRVREVQRYLDEAEKELRRTREVYGLCTTALRLMGEANRGPSFRRALDEISLISPSSNVSELKEGELALKLKELRKASMMNRSELLFLTLIPAIREKFVAAINDQSLFSLELIKWCTEHQMIIQALCIYRERVCRYLLDKGYFVALEAASELSEDARSKEICDLLKDCSFEREGLRLCKTTKDSETGKKIRTPHPYYRINGLMEGELRLIAIWFKYLQTTRNTIVHADGERGSLPYFLALEYLGKDRDEAVNLSVLHEDILEAVSATEHPSRVSNRDWRNARKSAFVDLDHFRQRSSGGSSQADVARPAKGSSHSSGMTLGGRLSPEMQAKLATIK